MKYSDVELTNTEVKILRYLTIPFSGIDRLNVTQQVVENRFNMDSEAASATIDRLMELGLIEPNSISKLSGVKGYALSPFGASYLKHRTESFHDHLIWSVAVPISVSLATTLITLALTR